MKKLDHFDILIKEGIRKEMIERKERKIKFLKSFLVFFILISTLIFSILSVNSIRVLTYPTEKKAYQINKEILELSFYLEKYFIISDKTNSMNVKNIMYFYPNFFDGKKNNLLLPKNKDDIILKNNGLSDLFLTESEDKKYITLVSKEYKDNFCFFLFDVINKDIKEYKGLYKTIMDYDVFFNDKKLVSNLKKMI